MSGKKISGLIPPAEALHSDIPDMEESETVISPKPTPKYSPSMVELDMERINVMFSTRIDVRKKERLRELSFHLRKPIAVMVDEALSAYINRFKNVGTHG